MLASVVLSATFDNTLSSSPLARFVTFTLRWSGLPASVVEEKSTSDVVVPLTLRRRKMLLGKASNAAAPDVTRYLMAIRSEAVASTVGNENGAGGACDPNTTVLLLPIEK